MLIFNPKRVMAMRGIDRMFSFLHKGGFIRSTASNLLNGQASHIKIEHIGKICVMLNCTPNDLFEWKQGSRNVILEDHALNAMVREKTTSLSELAKDVPIGKLRQIEEMLKDSKDG